MKGCLNKISTGNWLACTKNPHRYGWFDYKRALIPAVDEDLCVLQYTKYRCHNCRTVPAAAALQPPRYKCPILCPPSPEIRGHSLQTLDPGRGWLNPDTSDLRSAV